MFFNKYNFLLKDFTAQSTTRPEITGVFITPKGTIATDSFKIIEVESVIADPKDFPSIPDKPKMRTQFPSFILPEKKMADVLKLFNGNDDNVLSVLKNAVVLSRNKENVEIAKADMDGCNSVMSRIIEGEYPDYKSVMVEKGKYVEINVSPTFLKQIAVFFSSFVDNEDGVVLKVPVDKNNPVRFSGRRKETGQTANVVLMPIKSD